MLLAVLFGKDPDEEAVEFSPSLVPQNNRKRRTNISRFQFESLSVLTSFQDYRNVFRASYQSCLRD